MFHNDIMYSIMQERAAELRAEAQGARDAARARRARRFWEERAWLTATRGAHRRTRRAATTHGM